MTLSCLTPIALLALGDPGFSPPDARLTAAPTGIGVVPDRPGPPDAKPWYGTPYENSLVTTNFGLTWENGDATEEQAERAAAALEAAWTELVEVQGWEPPVSSDTYLLWILLVDDISATGYTTEYTTPEYRNGYPVIYLNTTMASDHGFWSTLASHEFHHAVQYAMRDYGEGAEGESWYWEASATWAANLVEPDTAALDYISAWYATQAAAAYTSTDGSHQYGMFVFNAWLETGGVVGEGAMQDAWRVGTNRPGASWRSILEESTGLKASALWGGFAAGYGNDSYWRADTWYDPDKTRLRVGQEATGEAAELGTVYYGALERVEVAVDTTDEVVVTGPGIVDLGDDRWDVPAGVTMAVTATGSAGASWTLTVTEPAGGEDTGDTGTDEDSGDTGTDEDTGGDGKGDGGKGGTNGPPAEEPGCGCTTTPAASVPLLAGVAGLALLRRRRGIVDLRASTAHSR